VPIYRIAVNEANYFNSEMVVNEAKVLSCLSMFVPLLMCYSQKFAVDIKFLLKKHIMVLLALSA